MISYVLTEEQIAEINRLRKYRGYTLDKLAKMFGVSMWSIRKVLKNENPPGSQKLTDEQIQEIRDLYKTGDYSCEKLGYMFDVAASTVNLLTCEIDLPRKDKCRRHPLPEQTISTIVEMFVQQGLNKYQIARSLQLPYNTVKRTLKKKLGV